MIKWLTKSRLRTALVTLGFFTVFLISFGFAIFWPLLHPHVFSAGATPHSAPSGFLQALTAYVPSITAIVTAIGTISTLILAWRTDRRTAKESELKMIQLQQQIAEMQIKLAGQ
jgi:hypothetical protein